MKKSAAHSFTNTKDEGKTETQPENTLPIGARVRVMFHDGSDIFREIVCSQCSGWFLGKVAKLTKKGYTILCDGKFCLRF
jgi:hypothetical protein